MTADTLRRAAPTFPALTVQALRSGSETQVRLTGHILDSDLRLLDETIDWLLAAGARHIVVDAHGLAGGGGVLTGWLSGYRQQSLVRRHVLSVSPVSRRRASR